MRIRAILMCTVLALLVIALVPAMAIGQEDDFNPPMPPSLPSSGSGSGGGGSGGSYSSEPFKPYAVNLTSPDGSPMGIIMVKDYSLASVAANKSFGNGSVIVNLSADLSSLPSNIGLDISPVDFSNVTLPLDLDTFSPFLAFNLTRLSNGGEWPMKSDTVYLNLSVPVSMLDGLDQGSQFYLVKDDGARYILYGVVPGIAGGMMTFDVPLWYEPGSPTNTGTFTLVGTKARTSGTAAATPSPTPVPITSTPKSGNGFVSLAVLITALAMAMVLYSRTRKQ